MSGHTDHIRQLDAKITALSAALADLGKGTGLKEMLTIIKHPGFTTVAEVALIMTILEAMAAQTATMAKTEASLVAAAKQVSAKTAVHA